MKLRFNECSAFEQKEIEFDDGINFYITSNKCIQNDIYRFLKRNREKVCVINSELDVNDISNRVYFVNYNEKGMLLRNRKFKSVIDTNSEIVKLLDIQSNVFELKFKQLWHWSYLCSCALGISKGKKILIFPWISSTECSVQSYRINKLFEYAQQNELIVVIPTDSIETLKSNTVYNMKYNIYE